MNGCPSTPAPTLLSSSAWRTCWSNRVSTTRTTSPQIPSASTNGPPIFGAARPSGRRRSPASMPTPSSASRPRLPRRRLRPPSSQAGAAPSAAPTTTPARPRARCARSTRFWAAGTKRAAPCFCPACLRASWMPASSPACPSPRAPSSAPRSTRCRSRAWACPPLPPILRRRAWCAACSSTTPIWWRAIPTPSICRNASRRWIFRSPSTCR